MSYKILPAVQISYIGVEQSHAMGQQKALESFFESLTGCERDIIDQINVYPGMIEGCVYGRIPFRKLYYDYTTGQVIDLSLDMIPERCQLKLIDDSLPF